MSRLTSRLGWHSASQLGTQGMGFLTGLIIVNALTKTEYAEYSIVIRVVAAAGYITDSGTSALLLERASRTSKEDIPALFESFGRARRVISWITAGVSVGWIGTLLQPNAISALGMTVVLLVATAILAPTLTMATSMTYLRHQTSLGPLRRSMLIGAAIRLAGSILLYIGSPGPAAWWLAPTVASAWWTHAYLRRASVQRGMTPSEASKDATSEFLRGWLRVTPLSILLVAAEQATLAIGNFRGSPEIVAELSALTRFAIIFAIVNTLVSDIVGPAVARAPNERVALARRIGAIGGVYFSIVLATGLLTWIFGDLLLALLGHQYAGLGTPLVVVAVGTALISAGHDLNTICLTRGWSGFIWLYGVLTVVWLAWAVAGAEISGIDDLAWIYCLQPAPMIAVQVARMWTGIRRTPRR